MSDPLFCWKCGESLQELPVPLARLSECPACRVDLHCCRMCGFYDTRVSGECREPVAEEVKDKERANFCGWFQANGAAYQPTDHKQFENAKTQLDALFGGAESPGEPFSQQSGGDAARDQLEQLFKK